MMMAEFQKIASAGDKFAVKFDSALTVQKYWQCIVLYVKEFPVRQKNFSKVEFNRKQPMRIYGLAKVHSNEIILRLVLSIPGHCYHSLNKLLTPVINKERLL